MSSARVSLASSICSVRMHSTQKCIRCQKKSMYSCNLFVIIRDIAAKINANNAMHCHHFGKNDDEHQNLRLSHSLMNLRWIIALISFLFSFSRMTLINDLLNGECHNSFFSSPFFFTYHGKSSARFFTRLKKLGRKKSNKLQRNANIDDVSVAFGWYYWC